MTTVRCLGAENQSNDDGMLYANTTYCKHVPVTGISARCQKCKMNKIRQLSRVVKLVAHLVGRCYIFGGRDAQGRRACGQTHLQRFVKFHTTALAKSRHVID